MKYVPRNKKGCWLQKKSCSKIETLLEKLPASCEQALPIECDLKSVKTTLGCYYRFRGRLHVFRWSF